MRVRGRDGAPGGGRERSRAGRRRGPGFGRERVPRSSRDRIADFVRERTGTLRERTGTARRRAGRVSLPLLLVVLATGCGIRATSVPTDFGPAPSRASCTLPRPTVEARSGKRVPVQIFLVCASQLVTVDRSVGIPNDSLDSRVTIAQALLDQLQLRPPTPERQAGYTTELRGGTTVRGSGPADQPVRLRLGTPVQDLNAYALAQIVCTLANSAAAEEDGAVILAGPEPEPLRRYTCPPEVISRPGTTAPPSRSVDAG